MPAQKSRLIINTMGLFDKIKKSADIAQEEPKEEKNPQKKNKKVKVQKQEEPDKKPEPPKEMPEKEGELSIDVYETDNDFIVQSTVAGVKSEDLDINIENDMVVIRGSRHQESGAEDKKYYYQECYWGSFSREVILPEEVDGSRAEASVKNGVLTLKIPKAGKKKKKKVAIKQED